MTTSRVTEKQDADASGRRHVAHVRASSLTSCPRCVTGWRGVFGDQVVAAAMIDRVVHHADVLSLKAPRTGYLNAGPTPCPASARPSTISRTGLPAEP